jgi:hypothetical protein
MAKRVAAEEAFGFTWQERPPRAVPLEDLTRDLDVSPRTKSRIVWLATHLAEHPAGLSFAALRTASALTNEDLRAVLDIALRAGVIRRSGAGNTLVYLVNVRASTL